MSELVYGSVCSGIEAASVAWSVLPWRAAWFSEIDPYCSKVLAHRFKETPNRGDFTKIRESEPLDLLVGGTPCQGYSIAGRRDGEGLGTNSADLSWQFTELAKRLRPEWVVWENVPGYSCVWRILDARYFGVPQQRRRLFVVANLRDYRRAASALLERQRLSYDYGDVSKTWLSHGLSNGKSVEFRYHSYTVTTDGGQKLRSTDYPIEDGRLRYFSPLELERLQGFPDDFTKVPGVSDARRTKMVGNSMAVPVMRWIGKRIQWVREIEP